MIRVATKLSINLEKTANKLSFLVHKQGFPLHVPRTSLISLNVMIMMSRAKVVCASSMKFIPTHFVVSVAL